MSLKKKWGPRIRTWDSEQRKSVLSETERYRKEGSRGREKTARGRNVGEKREKTQNYLVQGRTGSGVFSLHVINILNCFLYDFYFFNCGISHKRKFFKASFGLISFFKLSKGPFL